MAVKRAVVILPDPVHRAPLTLRTSVRLRPVCGPGGGGRTNRSFRGVGGGPDHLEEGHGLGLDCTKGVQIVTLLLLLREGLELLCDSRESEWRGRGTEGSEHGGG